MAARDKIHGAVKTALVKDGWTITDDPFMIVYKDVGLSADLGAERTLAAERGAERIVVEIKSFLGPSLFHDLEQALGQYGLYRLYLRLTKSEQVLFLAIDPLTYADFFRRESVQVAVDDAKLKLVIVNIETEEVMQWIA